MDEETDAPFQAPISSWNHVNRGNPFEEGRAKMFKISYQCKSAASRSFSWRRSTVLISCWVEVEGFELAKIRVKHLSW